MPLENPTSQVPESQVSAGEPFSGGDLASDTHDFENAFTSAAQAAGDGAQGTGNRGQAAAPAPTPAPTQTPVSRPPAPSQAPLPQRGPEPPAFTLEQYQDLQARYAQAQQYAALGQQFAPHLNEFQQFLTQQQQAQLAGQAQAGQPAETDAPSEFDREAYFKEKWGEPELSEQAKFALDKGIVQIDENGKYVPVAGYEMMAAPVLTQLNQYKSWHEDNVLGLFKGNFYEKVYGTLEKPLLQQVERLVEERLASLQQHTQTRSQIEQFQQQHASALYAADPVTGQMGLSVQGQALVEAINHVQQLGVTDPVAQLQLASQLVGLAQAGPAAQSPAGNAAAEGASPQGSAAAPAPTPPAAPPDKKRSFLDNAVARHSHAPSAQAAAQGAPVTQDAGELDRYFVNQVQVAAH